MKPLHLHDRPFDPAEYECYVPVNTDCWCYGVGCGWCLLGVSDE